jgi:hypothetical protein
MSDGDESRLIGEPGRRSRSVELHVGERANRPIGKSERKGPRGAATIRLVASASQAQSARLQCCKSSMIML